jgi:hypothetical protein
MYKGSAAKGSSTEDWLKREMAWHSVPHAYEEGLCKHFSKSHSRRGCPLPAGGAELRFALDKLPPMVVAGAYKLKIRATDEAGKPVACVRALVDVPRGKRGELFRRVEALPTVRGGRTLSARVSCACGPSDPVCGADGRTYAGACEAGCANVGVAYPGTCDRPVRPGERELAEESTCEDDDAGVVQFGADNNETVTGCSDAAAQGYCPIVTDYCCASCPETCEDYDSLLESYDVGYTECSALPDLDGWCADDTIRSTCCETCSAVEETCEDDEHGVFEEWNDEYTACSDIPDYWCSDDTVRSTCCETCSAVEETCEDDEHGVFEEWNAEYTACSDIPDYWCSDDTIRSTCCETCSAVTTDDDDYTGYDMDDDDYTGYDMDDDYECVCSTDYEPVCVSIGSDEYEYTNFCEAMCAGYTYIDGPCGGDVSGVPPRGLALLFSLWLAALLQ